MIHTLTIETPGRPLPVYQIRWADIDAHAALDALGSDLASGLLDMAEAAELVFEVMHYQYQAIQAVCGTHGKASSSPQLAILDVNGPGEAP